jgi:hypothetical protein
MKYCHIYARKQARCIPPGPGPEVITWIEIPSFHPVMHIDPCIMMPGHTLHIFPECWIVPPYRIYTAWSKDNKVWSLQNYYLLGNNQDCHFLKKSISQKLTKEILYYLPSVQRLPQTHTHTHMHRSTQIHIHTHTHIHTHGSLNSKHSGLRKFLYLHVRKVPFSSSDPYWILGNTGESG